MKGRHNKETPIDVTGRKYSSVDDLGFRPGRVYCPAQVELENLSAKLELQKQSGLLWKPTILESGTTHTPTRVRHAHITKPQGATTKRQP